MQVKSLLVKMGADTKGMEAGFQKADGLIAKHGEKIKKMGKAMTVAGAAIIGALGLMIKEYATTGDWIDKMSKRTGMGAVALSELAFAAQISGASLNDVEKGVKKMAKSIIDADAGLETYLRSFRRLGINVKELKAMKPEDQFIAIGTALGEMTDETEQAATAQEIFGRAGTTLLPLFKEGKEGIEALREEAHRLGIVFDEEAAAKAARLVDAQTRLKESMKGVSRSIAETFVPMLSDLAEKAAITISKITAWIKENPKLAGTIAKVVAAVGGILTVLGPLMMMLPGIIAAGPMVGAAFHAMLGPIGLVTVAIGFYIAKLLQAKAAQAELVKATERNNKQQEKLRKKLIEMKKAAGMTNKEFTDLTKKYNGNKIAMLHAVHAGKEGKKLQEALAKVGKEHAKVIDKQRKAQEKSAKVLTGKLDPALEKVIEKTETWVDFLKNMGIKTVEEKGKRVEQLEEYLKDLDQAYKDDLISIEDFVEATNAATQEIEGLSTKIATKAIPLIEDMSDEVDEAVTEMEGRIPDFTQAVEDSTEDVKTSWNDLPPHMRTILGGIGNAFGNMVSNIKIEGGKLKIDFNTLWNDIKGSFAQTISDMVSDWFRNFITKIISKTKDILVPGVTDALNEIKPAASSAGTAAGVSLTAAFVNALAVEAVVFSAFLGAVSLLDKLFPKHVLTMAEKAARAANEAFRDAAAEAGMVYEKGIAWTGEEEENGWAGGFEGVVTQPIRPLIGEAGPEHVKVTPLREYRKESEDFLPLSKPDSFLKKTAGGLGTGTKMFSFNPTVNIYARTLDDYTINRASEKIFAAMDRERRRRGY